MINYGNLFLNDPFGFKPQIHFPPTFAPEESENK